MSIEALLITKIQKQISEITDINTFSESFDFLNNEPEIYSISDLKQEYE